MYQTLYRKWRPKTFDDVCGQEHVSSILRYEVTEGKTSHAYLFCGSRGTGKTTCAKLLARALNCENPQNGNPCGVCKTCRGILSGAITDVIEMDAASNNGVDNIRDIRDEVAFAPTECKKRVFIIDEVHMLSTSAFNALLKTLEEPPEHIVFILATTEMNKIPATILSRCQRFDFRRIDASVIAARLRTIADAEGIGIDDDALFLIAKLANGGMRDAIGMLELCAASATDGRVLDSASAAELLGTSAFETTVSLVSAVKEKQYDRIFEIVDKLYRDAMDLGVFWQSLLSFYRDMLVIKTVASPVQFLELSGNQLQSLTALAGRFTRETLLYHIRLLDEVFLLLQKNTAPARITVETALIRMCDASLDDAPAALLSRISEIEDRIAFGIPAAVPETKNTVTAPAAEEPPAAADTVPTAEIPPDVPPIPESEPPESAEPPAATPPKKKPARSVPKEPEIPVSTERKVLRAFKGWADVVHKIETSDGMVGSLLRNCKAYTCEQDGKFYLRVKDGFSLKWLGQQNAQATVSAAVNLWLKEKKYTEQQIVLEQITEKQDDGYELVDELIEAAGGERSEKESK